MIVALAIAVGAIPITAHAQEVSGPQPDPFAFADFTWLTGNPRTKDAPLDSKAFTGEFRVDTNYTYSFNHPKDDTIGGSSEIFRSGEVQVTQLGIGGDFHYDNVRGRLMTQFGMYSQTTPRNDASPARGQWNLDGAYRYVSEAYGGYHWDKLNGINVDAGIFMSYVGLFSYYHFDNWAYQPSYVSSNTPWFFNGVRIQIFPSDKLKIEPWIINGWQSYGTLQQRAGPGRPDPVAPERLRLDRREQLLGQGCAGQPRSQARPHGRQHPGEVLRRAGQRSSARRRSPSRSTRAASRAAASVCSGGTDATPSQYLPRLHGLQPILVRARSLRADPRRRRDQQPRPLPGAAAAHQRRHGGLRDAIFHREPRRSVQGLGRLADLGLHAESVRDLPPRREPPRTRTCRISPVKVASRRQAGNVAPLGSTVSGWAPDLRTSESRMTAAVLVKF